MNRDKQKIKNLNTSEGPSSQEMDKIHKRPTDEKSSIECLKPSSKPIIIPPSIRLNPSFNPILIEKLPTPMEDLIDVATQTEHKRNGIIVCILSHGKENSNENNLATISIAAISSCNDALKVMFRNGKTGTPTDDTLNHCICVKNKGTQTDLTLTNIRDRIANKRAVHKYRTENLYLGKMLRHSSDFNKLALTQIKASSSEELFTPPPGFPVYLREPDKSQKQTIRHSNCLNLNESKKSIQENRLAFVPSNYSKLYEMVLQEKERISTCVNDLIASLKKKDPSL